MGRPGRDAVLRALRSCCAARQADHLVVLGWGPQTLSLLRQVAAARKANSDPLFA